MNIGIIHYVLKSKEFSNIFPHCCKDFLKKSNLFDSKSLLWDFNIISLKCHIQLLYWLSLHSSKHWIKQVIKVMSTTSHHNKYNKLF